MKISTSNLKFRLKLALGLGVLCWLVFAVVAGLPILERVAAQHPEQPFPVIAQNPSGGRRPSVIQPGQPAVSFVAAEADGFVIYEADGRHVCRGATPEEALNLRLRDPESMHRIIDPQARLGQETEAGLQIILRGTSQLEAFPQAKAAFLRAAAKWAALIRNPITIVVDVDYGPTRFGEPWPQGVIGSAGGQGLIGNGYLELRSKLIAGAAGQQEAALYNTLPASTVPTDLGGTTVISVNSAVLRALELIPPIADPDGELSQFGPPPSIGFNSIVNYDFDPSNGVDAGKTDFEGVALHELGHVLGFTSAAGYRELSPGFPVSVSTLDLFRFRPGVAAGSFSTAARILSSGGEHRFFDSRPEAAFSTGRPDGSGGDNRQASHWKDDLLNGGQYIGLMDPTDSPGRPLAITENDLRAFEAMGYQLNGGGATTETLLTDDGSAEGGFIGDGLIVVNRLTPSQYPSTLQTIRIFFGQFTNQPNPSGAQIKLIAFAGAAGSTRPPNNPQLLLNQTATLPTVPSGGGFIDFPIPNGPKIPSGDFYIGFQLPTPFAGVGAWFDTNGPQQQRGFYSTNNGSIYSGPIAKQDGTPTNLMIRAVVVSGEVSNPADRIVRAAEVNGAPGAIVRIPISIQAQGDEVGVQFSLRFDPALLTNPQAEAGGDATDNRFFQVNPTQIGQGRLGVVLLLRNALERGTKQIAVVSFTVAAGARQSIPISFDDSPTPKRVIDVSSQALDAVYVAGAVTIDQVFEGDVNNDKVVDIADAQLVINHLTGRRLIQAGPEFQRADCAPKENKGDGLIGVDDALQVILYAVSNELVPAGGPSEPQPGAVAGESGGLSHAKIGQARSATIAQAGLAEEYDHSFVVTLDARGDESAVSFSLQFDPQLVRFAGAAAGPDARDAWFVVNSSETEKGRIGVALLWPSGRSLAAGARTVALLRFAPASGESAFSAAMSFTNQPLPLRVVNGQGETTAAQFTDASVTIRPGAVATLAAEDYSFSALPPDSLAVSFGAGLATMTLATDGPSPPTRLAGGTVLIRDSLGIDHFAPLLFVSSQQVNYRIPAKAAMGGATVTITSADGNVSTGLIQIADRAQRH